MYKSGRTAIAELQSTIKKFKGYHQSICQRFDDQYVDSIQQQARLKLLEIAESRSNFEHTPRQVQAVTKIEKDVQKTLQDIGTHWKDYVNAMLTPHTEMLSLVHTLPEIAVQEGIINNLLLQLREFIRTPPATEIKLREFDTKLQQLSERLDVLHGISPQIQVFLRKVQGGTATLNDLTDEILSWCRQDEHASVFAISFRSRKGA